MCLHHFLFSSNSVFVCKVTLTSEQGALCGRTSFALTKPLRNGHFTRKRRSSPLANVQRTGMGDCTYWVLYAVSSPRLLVMKHSILRHSDIRWRCSLSYHPLICFTWNGERSWSSSCLHPFLWRWQVFFFTFNDNKSLMISQVVTLPPKVQRSMLKIFLNLLRKSKLEK